MLWNRCLYLFIYLDSAKEILAASQLEVLDNCIKSVIDSSGIVYNLPNFLINDPLFIKEYDKLKGIENKEQKLTVDNN